MKLINIFLLIIFTSLLSLGQLQRITLGPVTALYVHDVVLSIWIFFLIMTNVKKVFQDFFQLMISFFSNKTVVLLFLLILIGWTGAVASNTFPLWTLLYSIRLLTYLTWGWLLFKLKPLTQNWLLLTFISSGLLIGLFGLLQYFLIPDTRFLSILGWDDHFYRLLSTQLDPNFTGLLLIITLFWLWSVPFHFWQWLIHGPSKKQLMDIQKISTGIASGMLLVGIGLTFSRSSLLALLVGGVIFVLIRFSKEIKNKKMTSKISTRILAVTGIVIITLIAAPKPSGEGVKLWRTSSAYARIVNTSNWVYSLEPYHLVMGRGLFVPPPQELLAPTGITADHANLPDNFFILLLSGIGIPGIVLCMLLLARKLPTVPVDAASTAIFGSVLTHSLFNNSLLQAFILLFLLAKMVENEMRNQLLEKIKATIETKP